jgi:hypothetical protein
MADFKRKVQYHAVLRFRLIAALSPDLGQSISHFLVCRARVNFLVSPKRMELSRLNASAWLEMRGLLRTPTVQPRSCGVADHAKV